jgi:hypothetical protein
VSPERENPVASVWRAETAGKTRPGRLERCVIPARAFIIRFPNGDFEYDLSRNAAPTIGATIRRQGLLWSVVRVNGDDVREIHVEQTPDQGARAPLQDDALP